MMMDDQKDYICWKPTPRQKRQVVNNFFYLQTIFLNATASTKNSFDKKGFKAGWEVPGSFQRAAEAQSLPEGCLCCTTLVTPDWWSSFLLRFREHVFVFVSLSWYSVFFLRGGCIVNSCPPFINVVRVPIFCRIPRSKCTTRHIGAQWVLTYKITNLDATRVSACIYCFMNWGEIVAQYTLNFSH